MFKRKTRKTVPNEGNKKGQRAVTHRADQSGKTWAFHLSWIRPYDLLSRDAGNEGTNGGHDEHPQGTSVQRPWWFSKQNQLAVYHLRQFLSPTTEILHVTDWKLWRVKDPLDHLETFKTLMHLQEVLDEIMCGAFPTTLKGPARIWFNRLTPNSINTFKETVHPRKVHPSVGGTAATGTSRKARKTYLKMV